MKRKQHKVCPFSVADNQLYKVLYIRYNIFNLMIKEKGHMQENVNIAAEIISAIISTAIGTPLAYGGSLVKRKIERRILFRRVKKREAYLVSA